MNCCVMRVAAVHLRRLERGAGGVGGILREGSQDDTVSKGTVGLWRSGGRASGSETPVYYFVYVYSSSKAFNPSPSALIEPPPAPSNHELRFSCIPASPIQQQAEIYIPAFPTSNVCAVPPPTQQACLR